MAKILIGITTMIFCFQFFGTSETEKNRLLTSASENWADSMLNTMTLEEKIGQLFMVRAHSNKGIEHENDIKNLIKKYKIGGLCFFQGTSERQVVLTNEYQELSSIPLMISMDAEWGPSMRLKQELIEFPRQMTMGALQDNRLIFQFGQEVARELVRLGVHINFAPCIDINNNEYNPVIGSRSFGEDKYMVSQKGYMYMLGMQSAGIMACAKHFPGHGDTHIDSHKDVPELGFDSLRLNEFELYPFKVLIQQGIQSVMIGHLVVPSLEPTIGLPASLSRSIITGWLKERLGFNGLIFTDALDMKGVTKNFQKGEIEVKALEAGVDVLLLSEDVPLSIQAIHLAIEQGKLSFERLNQSVRKIFISKYQFGLQNSKKIVTQGLKDDLNSVEAKALNQKIIEQAITLVKNESNLIPIEYPLQQVSSLIIGESKKSVFQSQLQKYGVTSHFQMNANFTDQESELLRTKISKQKLIVIGLLNLNNSPSSNYGISPMAMKLIHQLSEKSKVVLVGFGSPYLVKYFDKCNAILAAFDDDSLYQKAAAQAIMGGLPILGKLPVSAGKFKSETGIIIEKTIRLGYTMPENVGMSSQTLNGLDKLATELIRKGASPGCQMLIIKDGMVVFDKSYGSFSYSSNEQVNDSTIYDLASITKVAATTLAIMKLYQEGKIDIFSNLGGYIPELRGSNKEFLIIRDVMAHRAGLIPWIPYYKGTLAQSGSRVRPSADFYKNKRNDSFLIKVAHRLYLKNSTLNSFWNEVIQSQLLPSNAYRYSDLGFILLRKVVENVANKPFDQYLEESFYRPMALKNMSFLPLKKYDHNRIAPTEEDKYFRQQRLQGNVHDMAAAMMGGLSGHAGLFSNAEDLATLFYMLINDGSYGGIQYLNPEVIRLFTCRHNLDTRRGIGFDMPQLDWNSTQNVTSKASKNTFGHIGFTGTAVWADPTNKCVFVFLSNRTYPTMENNSLERYNYRMKAHAILYDAIKEYKEQNYQELFLNKFSFYNNQ